MSADLTIERFALIGPPVPTRIELVPEDDPQDPRREWDNFGTMLCGHRDYNLGDRQLGRDEDLMQEVYEEVVPGAAQLALDDHISDLYDEIDLAYEEGKIDRTCRNDRRSELEDKEQEERLKAIHAHAVVLPLFLYDHSGLSISTGEFSCPLDSGLVGVIYISHEKIRKEYQLAPGTELTPEILEKAKQGLEIEVETYDQYLTGDVWGFVVYDQLDQEIDSCWGFYGDDPKKNGIMDHLDHHLKGLPGDHPLRDPSNWERKY